MHTAHLHPPSASLDLDCSSTRPSCHRMDGVAGTGGPRTCTPPHPTGHVRRPLTHAGSSAWISSHSVSVLRTTHPKCQWRKPPRPWVRISWGQLHPKSLRETISSPTWRGFWHRSHCRKVGGTPVTWRFSWAAISSSSLSRCGAKTAASCSSSGCTSAEAIVSKASCCTHSPGLPPRHVHSSAGGQRRQRSRCSCTAADGCHGAPWSSSTHALTCCAVTPSASKSLLTRSTSSDHPGSAASGATRAGKALGAPNAYAMRGQHIQDAVVPRVTPTGGQVDMRMPYHSRSPSTGCRPGRLWNWKPASPAAGPAVAAVKGAVGSAAPPAAWFASAVAARASAGPPTAPTAWTPATTAGVVAGSLLQTQLRQLRVTPAVTGGVGGVAAGAIVGPVASPVAGHVAAAMGAVARLAAPSAAGLAAAAATRAVVGLTTLPAAGLGAAVATA